MTRRVQSGLVVVIVIAAAHGLAGCGPEPSVPSSPSPVALSQTPLTLPQSPLTVHAWLPGVVFDSNTNLSGFVFEIAQGVKVPVERAWVYCERCGEETHAGMWTDKQGLYSFKGVWGYAFPISVSKDDYRESGWRDVILNGNTRFDVQLERK